MASSSPRSLVRERGPFRFEGLAPEAEETAPHETLAYAAERHDEDEWDASADGADEAYEADEADEEERVDAIDEVAPHRAHKPAHAAPRVTATDLIRRWNLATNVPEYPRFHQLVDHWRGEVGAGYMPVSFLVAFSAHETARGFGDQTAGIKNAKGVYEPAYYELGVFQVPAGLHGRGTGTTYRVPGKRNGNAWFRFCALFHLDPADWRDPNAQVRIGIANLASDAANVRNAFPELFGDPGSDWALRAAVLLPFGPGAGYTHKLLHRHRKHLANLAEEARWPYLQKRGARTANPDGKMALGAQLVALLGKGAIANEAADTYETRDADEEGDTYEGREADDREDAGEMEETGEFAAPESLDGSEDANASEDVGQSEDEEQTEDEEESESEEESQDAQEGAEEVSTEVDFEDQIAAATLETNLASVVVTTSTVDYRDAPNAFDFSAIASANTDKKRSAFLPAQRAYNRLLAIQPPHGAAYEAARADVRAKSQALALFLRDHGLAHNRALRKLSAMRKANAKALAAAKKHAHPNAARIRGLEANHDALRGIIATSTTALTAAIRAFRPQIDFRRNVFTVDVGGTVVRLHDHELTYASDTPAGMEGKADGDDHAAVVTALAAAGLSADTQAVLRIVSGNEGSFTTMNTWDRGVVTFGFIQWTFDEDGTGTLKGLLAAIKSDHSDIFRARYEAYGIDVDHGSLVVTLPRGGALRGGVAARYMQTDPKLVAVMSAAGNVPEVRATQIAFAVQKKITDLRAARVHVGHASARIGDLVSSTYGVGLLTDVAVHAGEGGAREHVAQGLAKFLKSEPSADLTLAATIARVEPFVIEALGIDPQRDVKFAALDHAPGSFTP